MTVDEPDPDWTPAPGAVWAGRDPDLADQPPEVEHLEPGHPTSLPPPTPAAERVAEFLGWFGDGMVNGQYGRTVIAPLHPDEPPLYARDLAALVDLARHIRTRTSWSVVRNSVHMGYGDRETSEALARDDYARRVKTLHVGESLRLERTTVAETYQAQTTVVESRTKT